MADSVFASDSILNTIKRSLDIATDDTSFDTALLIHINTVFSDLYQLGLGTYGSDEYELIDEAGLWLTAVGLQKNLSMIKSYMVLRIRLIFDPPATGFTTTSMQNQIDKMEWRIKVAASSLPNPQEV